MLELNVPVLFETIAQNSDMGCVKWPGGRDMLKGKLTLKPGCWNLDLGHDGELLFPLDNSLGTVLNKLLSLFAIFAYLDRSLSYETKCHQYNIK